MVCDGWLLSEAVEEDPTSTSMDEYADPMFTGVVMILRVENVGCRLCPIFRDSVGGKNTDVCRYFSQRLKYLYCIHTVTA